MPFRWPPLLLTSCFSFAFVTLSYNPIFLVSLKDFAIPDSRIGFYIEHCVDTQLETSGNPSLVQTWRKQFPFNRIFVHGVIEGSANFEPIFFKGLTRLCQALMSWLVYKVFPGSQEQLQGGLSECFNMFCNQLSVNVSDECSLNKLYIYKSVQHTFTSL